MFLTLRLWRIRFWLWRSRRGFAFIVTGRGRRRQPVSRAAAVVSLLAQLEPAERAEVATAAIGGVDAGGFARVCATMFVRLGDIAKTDPREAGRLAAALYGHLSAYRPESPAPLDAGFVPTETARDPRGSR